MPDTTRAIWAIRAAYSKRTQVNGGLSTAELKLQAAGATLRLDEGETLPWPEDSPAWIEHARDGLAEALAACDKLRWAIERAQAEVAKLGGPPVTCRHCGKPLVACEHPAHPLCKGWFHAGHRDQPIIGHCCEGRSIHEVAEPAQSTNHQEGTIVSEARIKTVTIAGAEEDRVIRAAPDARSVTVELADGVKVTVYADGATNTEGPDGSKVSADASGNVQATAARRPPRWPGRSDTVVVSGSTGVQVGDGNTQVGYYR